MSAAAPAAPPAPTTQPTPAPAPTVAIPEVSSAPPAAPGAQGVKPAPPGTIPSPLKSFSDRPDSAKNKMFGKLRNRSPQPSPQSNPAPEAKGEAAAAPDPDAAPQPESKPEADEDLMGGEPKPADKPADKPEEKPGASEAQAADDKKGKPNPWKMLDERKVVVERLEKELSEVKKLIPNVEARKAEIAEIEKLRARNEELEGHIRFKDYEQSTEFKEKYDQPYKNQWKNSMKELAGVTVLTDQGEREISSADMLELVTAPLSTARQIANEKFGDFAADVMDQRKAIRDAYENRENALKEAKKNGAEREKELADKSEETRHAIVSEAKSVYESATEAIMKDQRHSRYIANRDGDDDGNALMAKGYEFVDNAFKQSPLDPSLTKEQRASIVKRHAAVRHKAAAYNRLVRDLRAAEAAHEETKKKLAQYESTVPGRENNTPASAPSDNGGRGMAGLAARLRAKATPART